MADEIAWLRALDDTEVICEGGPGQQALVVVTPNAHVSLTEDRGVVWMHISPSFGTTAAHTATWSQVVAIMQGSTPVGMTGSPQD